MAQSYSTKFGGEQKRVGTRGTKEFWLQLPLTLGVAGAILSAAAARGQSTTTETEPPPPPPVLQFSKVNDVVVRGHTAAQAAQARLNKIPGGVSIVSSAQVSRGRAQSNADLLKLQPGVIAAATGAGGFDSVKVSIRGSGVNNGVGYFRNGIKYEFDDLPVTTPSGTPYELFDPQGLNYTEILRGDNAFTTGALALGGTINYVTNTGRTAPYTELRTEFGSFGYVKGMAATGGVVGPWDYYIMVTGERQDGFQQQSQANAQHLAINLGYQINSNIETRIYLRVGREFFENPGALTRGQLESNPSQASLTSLETDSKRLQPGSELIGDVTKIRLDDTQNIELGLAYQNFPIVIEEPTTSAPIDAKWNYGNVAAQVKYTNNADLFGHGNALTLAGYWSDDIYGDAQEIATANAGTYPFGTSYNGTAIPATTYFGIKGLTKGLLYQTKFNGSTDAIALISNDFEAIHNVWLTLGGGFVAVPRNLSIAGVTGVEANAVSSSSYSQTDERLIPRLGLRWDVDPELQLFTSYGSNVEPREDWSGTYGPFSGTVAEFPTYNILNLKPQFANTFEIGLRGRHGIFQGSADFYDASVRDELLTIYDPTLLINSTINAPPATHEGVESALDTLLWQDGSGPWDSSDASRSKLHFAQTYNWSNFHFDGDPTFHNNQEPGIPEHYYQGELGFDRPSGFYANFDVTYSSSVWVDYLNTFKTAPYTVFGLTVGWQQPRADKKGWQVSFSINNLLNTPYAVAVAPVYSAGGQDVANEYPGNGFGVYSAVDYKF
jgi:iron complex outermembrane receptor protein